MTGIGVSILRDHISKGGTIRYGHRRLASKGSQSHLRIWRCDIKWGAASDAGILPTCRLPESQRTRVTGSIKSFEWDMLRIPACFQAFGLSSLCRFYVKSEQSSFFTRSCNPETNPGGFESFFRHLNSSCGTSVCPMMSWLSMRGARVSAYPPVVEMQGPEP